MTNIKQLVKDINLVYLLNSGKFDAQITSDNGKCFIIVDSWDTVFEIEDYVRRQCKPSGSEPNSLLYFSDIVEALTGNGENWGFADEYKNCERCLGLIRFYDSSDYYTKPYDDIICGNCVREEQELRKEYIEEYLLNNPHRANTILDKKSLVEAGFKELEGEYITGLHEHQNDDPATMLEYYESLYDVIFNIKNTDQFSTNWTMWIRRKGE